MFQSRKPQPAIYIRCLLQSLLFHDMRVLGKITITTLIYDDLAELVLPADVLLDPANGNVEAPHDPRFQLAKKMSGFVLRIGDVGCCLRSLNLAYSTVLSYSPSWTFSGRYA